MLPDLILNVLNLKCDPASVGEVLEFLKGDVNSPCQLFDLSRIVPMPEAVEAAAEAAELDKLIRQCFPRQSSAFAEVLARAEYECLTKTGYATSEYWAWSSWGTPRNVCYARYSKAFPHELAFNTLYAPPVQALAELSRIFADVVMELYYESADLTVVGWALFADGDVCDERLLKD